MDKAAVLMLILENAVQQGVAIFDEAFIGQRIEAQAAQRHHHLDGAFHIPDAPATEIARILLQRGQQRQSVVHRLPDGLRNLSLPVFRLVGVHFFTVIIRGQRLQYNGGDVGIRSFAGEGEALVL